MPFLLPSDLKTHLYDEVVTEITRGDDSLTTNAIAAAVQEAKIYLSKFDLVALFGTAETDPTFTDAYLLALVKDLATWHLLRIANPGTDNAIARTAYEDAIGVLKSIQNGSVQPAGWPYADTAAESVPDGNSINWSSVPKRSNYY